MDIITKNKNKSNFKEYIDNKIYLKEINNKIWKNYLYVKNDNYSKFMNLNDLEYFLQKKQDGIFNDIMNSIPFLKNDKKTRFITLTLNSPIIRNFEKIKDNDEKLKDIKNQYNIINNFKKSVFMKRKDKKNNLEKIDTITKNELTKRKVVHQHLLIFYKDIKDLITIINRIQFQKQKNQVGRVEIVIPQEDLEFIKDVYDLKSNKKFLYIGNFQKGNFTYFKKLDEKKNIFKYVYKYLNKKNDFESNVFKLCKIPKMTYSKKFFNGYGKRDIEKLNPFFHKIQKNKKKIFDKFEELQQLKKINKDDPELNFDFHFTKLQKKIRKNFNKHNNNTFEIIRNLKNGNVIINKNKTKIFNRYEIKGFMFFNLPIFEKNKLDTVTHIIKQKWNYNFNKYIENKNFYDNNNVFNLHYKYHFIKSFYKNKYNKKFPFDFLNFKKFLDMMKHDQDEKREEITKKIYDELEKSDENFDDEKYEKLLRKIHKEIEKEKKRNLKNYTENYLNINKKIQNKYKKQFEKFEKNEMMNLGIDDIRILKREEINEKSKNRFVFLIENCFKMFLNDFDDEFDVLFPKGKLNLDNLYDDFKEEVEHIF